METLNGTAILYGKSDYRLSRDLKSAEVYFTAELFGARKKKELCVVNRYEDHPDFGMAFPAFLMKKDLDIIEDLGCNAVRGSHYPNAKIFLDMLDQRGILFWSEIPIWGGGLRRAAGSAGLWR